MMRGMRTLWPLLLIACGSVSNRAADAPEAGDASMDAPDLLRGLVAWYQMDAIADGRMPDAIGNHTGMCDPASCPTVTTSGRIGNAYVFGAGNTKDIVIVPSASELLTTTGFTVTAWFKLEQDALGCLVNKVYSAAGVSDGNSWQACLGDSKLSFYSTSPPLRYGPTLAAGQWYHVALTWDGQTQAQALYFQGMLVAQQAGVTLSFDDGPITIGADLDNRALMAEFHGVIDDVRIYNRALPPVEIMALQSP
jgi:hypothetical protein